jgi:hypothetical protein
LRRLECHYPSSVWRLQLVRAEFFSFKLLVDNNFSAPCRARLQLCRALRSRRSVSSPRSGGCALPSDVLYQTSRSCEHSLPSFVVLLLSRSRSTAVKGSNTRALHVSRNNSVSLFLQLSFIISSPRCFDPFLNKFLLLVLEFEL